MVLADFGGRGWRFLMAWHGINIARRFWFSPHRLGPLDDVRLCGAVILGLEIVLMTRRAARRRFTQEWR